ncbi:hypothetical protein BH10BAC3_BH10BAC3_23620 [soil metagenome]
MKDLNGFIYQLILYFLLLVASIASAQNVGIGTPTPNAKLHIKGSEDATQFVIDAGSTQGNTRPLIRLRKSNGTDLMWINSDDTSNVFIGRNVGRLNTATVSGGINNTFIGSNSAYSNTTGSLNSAIGAKSFYFNSTGDANTVYGATSLRLNTTGQYNTAAGTGALYSNTFGIENTAVGSTALYSNTSGQDNTATGVNTLRSNSTGSYNTSIGYQLPRLDNSTGSFNTEQGVDALLNITTGNYNTASGYQSLYQNTTGSYNVAIGHQSLFKNTTGIFNSAMGNDVLGNNSSGQQNLAIGNFSLNNLINASNNTVVGEGAGSGTIYYMGWNNTLMGESSIANAAGIFNSIAIGKSSATTANNQVRIGNSFTASIGGFAGWSNISDGRVKKNVQENVPGLAFIAKLKPVTYNLSLEKADTIMTIPPEKKRDGKLIRESALEVYAHKLKEQIVYTGFIAQDVEKAAKELGFDFSGVDAAKHNADLYALRYAEFVVPLVKAAQELSERNVQLKKQQEEMKKRLEKLERALNLKNK